MLRKQWFYRRGKPTRLGLSLNRIWARVYSLGILPSPLVTLEVKGRRSGRTTRTAVVVAAYEGERYLVSMLGGSVDWVRNVRAAGGEAVLLHGKPERVRLAEVPVEQRGPILRSYYHRASGARWHFPPGIDTRSSVDDFRRVAEGFPAFRIIPLDAP